MNSTSKCNQCPVSTPRGTQPPPTTTSTDTPTSSTPATPPNAYSHYSSAKLMADTTLQNTSDLELDYDVTPYDGELDKNSNYTGFVQLIGELGCGFFVRYGRANKYSGGQIELFIFCRICRDIF